MAIMPNTNPRGAVTRTHIGPGKLRLSPFGKVFSIIQEPMIAPTQIAAGSKYMNIRRGSAFLGGGGAT